MSVIQPDDREACDSVSRPKWRETGGITDSLESPFGPWSSLGKTNICHLIFGDGWGGTERHVRDLAESQGRSLPVTVIGNSAFAGRLEHCDLEEINTRRGRLDPRLWWKVCRILFRIRPGLIHGHGAKAAFLVKRLRRLFPRSATVVTAHGLKRRVSVFKGVDQVIAVSAAVKNRLGSIPCRVINNGIDSNVGDHTSVASDCLEGDCKSPVLLTVGRLADVKGVDVLLEAFVKVPGELWIVGDGPEREALELRAKELGVADRVKFLGWRADVDTLMRAADIVVMPSRREGLPYVLIESLMLERPVIASAVGGIPEFVPQQYLVEPEDSRALAELLVKVCHARDELSRDFVPVFKRAQSELSLRKMSEATAEVYRDAIERHFCR